MVQRSPFRLKFEFYLEIHDLEIVMFGFLNSTRNADVHLDIFDLFVLLSDDKLHREADFISQQNLDPGPLPKLPKAASCIWLTGELAWPGPPIEGCRNQSKPVSATATPHLTYAIS